MERALTRRRALRASLAAGLALSGVRARGCEFFSTTLRVTHPWTRASADGASSAIVCMTFDEVRQDDRLIGVTTDIAAAAEWVADGAAGPVDLAIAKGQVIVLAEHTRHLRLLGLKQPLEVACTYPLRLVFAHGGVLDTDLSVDYINFA